METGVTVLDDRRVYIAEYPEVPNGNELRKEFAEEVAEFVEERVSEVLRVIAERRMVASAKGIPVSSCIEGVILHISGRNTAYSTQDYCLEVDGRFYDYSFGVQYDNRLQSKKYMQVIKAIVNRPFKDLRPYRTSTGRYLFILPEGITTA